jgi:hypothetical protein
MSGWTKMIKKTHSFSAFKEEALTTGFDEALLREWDPIPCSGLTPIHSMRMP